MARLKSLVRAVLPRGVRNWLRAPRKSLAWGWRHACYWFGAREVIELRPGWRLVCHPLAYRHSYHAQQDDPEQAAEFDSFIAHCSPGMVLFDLGAHFGLFALAALHYGGPQARAVAVDASPAAARMIETQARLNGVADRLRVVRACAADTEGERDMVAVGVLADGYFTPPGRDHVGRERASTPATTLDALVRATGLRPTHVKIDVESFEGDVLRGGRELLTGERPPELFLELHNALLRERGEDPAAVLAQLEEFDYRVFDLSGAPAERAALLARPLVRLIAKKRGAQTAPAASGGTP